MKKKRELIIVFFVLALFVTATLPAFASAEEYRVVKNAVKNKKSNGDVTWFKLEVKDKTANKIKVKIKIPLSLVEMFSDCEKKEKINIAGKCDINLKKILHELKKNGPMTLIEVDDEDELVRIWFE